MGFLVLKRNFELLLWIEINVEFNLQKEGGGGAEAILSWEDNLCLFWEWKCWSPVQFCTRSARNTKSLILKVSCTSFWKQYRPIPYITNSCNLTVLQRHESPWLFDNQNPYCWQNLENLSNKSDLWDFYYNNLY